MNHVHHWNAHPWSRCGPACSHQMPDDSVRGVCSKRCQWHINPSVHGFSQWETMLYCNVTSHWLCPYTAVLWISGCPVAKCDPLFSRAIQHDPWSRTTGDPAAQHCDTLFYTFYTRLTHWGPIDAMTEIWVNIGSGNGLLPYSTKSLPGPILTITWTNVDLSSVRSNGIHLSGIIQDIPQPWKLQSAYQSKIVIKSLRG